MSTTPEITDELHRRLNELAEKVATLHWDLGGLTYEMAIRDHFRLDVLVRKAAELQEADAELGEVERLVADVDQGVGGQCRACGAPHSRGDTRRPARSISDIGFGTRNRYRCRRSLRRDLAWSRRDNAHRDDVLQRFVHGHVELMHARPRQHHEVAGRRIRRRRNVHTHMVAVHVHRDRSSGCARKKGDGKMHEQGMKSTDKRHVTHTDRGRAAYIPGAAWTRRGNKPRVTGIY